MSERAARHLANNGAGKILVANRTSDRAVRLAEEIHGSAVDFGKLEESLGRRISFITSTGSVSHLITREMIAGALHRRKNRLMFLIDIAVPRDIDPAVNEIDNVYLYNMMIFKRSLTTT